MPYYNGIINRSKAPAVTSGELVDRPLAIEDQIFINRTAPQDIQQVINGVWVTVADTGAGTTGTLQTVTQNGAVTTILSEFSGGVILPGTTAQYVTGDGSLATFPTVVSAFTNDAGYVTASSTNTFTNKTGNISQWTNNVGYLTSSGAVTSITGTANQVIASAATGAVTLSLPQSIATSSNVIFNKISLSGAQYSYLANGGGFNLDLIVSGDDNIVFYTGNAMTNQGGFQDGSGLQLTLSAQAPAWVTNGGTTSQYVTGTGSLVVFPTNVSAFTNDAGYVTASSTNTFTNKTGNISQWTNNVGYLTSSGAVTSITGTANQVIASAATGAVTLSLPQSIATSSNVTFATGTFSNNGDGSVTVVGVGASNNAYLKLNAGSGANAFINSIGSGYLAIGANGAASNAITVLSNGNIGVATTTPDPGTFSSGSMVLQVNKGAQTYAMLKTSDGTNNFHVVTGASQHWLYATGNVPVVVYSNSVLAVTITAAQVINTTSRVNINGAADSANFALNVSGCTYTNSFSPTFSTRTTSFTVGDNFAYVFTGGAGQTATMENPATTNKLIVIKNWSANTLTVAGYAGGTNIIDTTNTAVASFNLTTGQTVLLQQDGASRTFILNIY